MGFLIIVCTAKNGEVLAVVEANPLNAIEDFAGMVARVKFLRRRMKESTRQVEGQFESLLAEAFDGGR